MPARVDTFSPAIATNCLVVSAVALGAAVQIADGFYNPAALVLVAGALALCAAGLCLKQAGVEGWAAWSLRLVLAGGIAGQSVALFVASPGMYLRPDASLEIFRVAVVVQA